MEKAGKNAGFFDALRVSQVVLSSAFSSVLRQNALLITPPSTRSAAPVVAEASGLTT